MGNIAQSYDFTNRDDPSPKLTLTRKSRAPKHIRPPKNLRENSYEKPLPRRVPFMVRFSCHQTNIVSVCCVIRAQSSGASISCRSRNLVQTVSHSADKSQLQSRFRCPPMFFIELGAAGLILPVSFAWFKLPNLSNFRRTFEGFTQFRELTSYIVNFLGIFIYRSLLLGCWAS